jgi:hypothetical protein
MFGTPLMRNWTMAMFMDRVATIITECLSHPDATRETPRPGGQGISPHAGNAGAVSACAGSWRA